MTDNQCPFCQAKRHKPPFRQDTFRCGTRGPDANGEYRTSSLCDAACFREAYLRTLDEAAVMRDLLRESLLHPWTGQNGSEWIERARKAVGDE